MTLPGVDVTVAEALLAAWGDVTRFPTPPITPPPTWAWFLPPSSRPNTATTARITKQGSSHARWMLIEAAQHLDKHPGPLGVFFRRLAKKKNRNVAVVAAARKLATIAWQMLRHNEPYRYALPATVEAKFARLRIRVTGQRRKGGLSRGQPRPAQYGHGRTRAVPALASVYQAEQLPALAHPAGGEKRMLDRNQLTEWAAALHLSKRKPKGAATGAAAPAIS